MTTPVTTLTPLRERLVAVLAALDYGMYPPDGCPACPGRPDQWCEACAQAFVDCNFIDTAITEIDSTETGEAEALALYAKTFIMLTGIKPGEFAEALAGGVK